MVSDARVAGADHLWRLELPPEPVLVSGDQHRLHQLLANLLANARVHTAPGSTVTTGLTTDLASLHQPAVLTVSDYGTGIDPALQASIFGRFLRGDQSRSRAAGSTGMGLAIVAAVTAAHKGTVAVDSGPAERCSRCGYRWAPDLREPSGDDGNPTNQKGLGRIRQ